MKFWKLSPRLLDLRKYIESDSTLEWLETREHNMSVIKNCLGAEYQKYIRDIDIGVSEEMLLGDLLIRINCNQDTLWRGGDPDVEATNERMYELMANNPQFGTNSDPLCPELEEVFCVCLHAMVYATIDITNKSSSLPPLEEMKCIIKTSPAVHGTEVQKKEFALQALAAAYRKAKEGDLLLFLPLENRRKILLSVKRNRGNFLNLSLY